VTINVTLAILAAIAVGWWTSTFRRSLVCVCFAGELHK